jgi:hypothetical protein
MARLQVGDLVQYVQGPERLGVVVMTHVTKTGAEVCEVIVVLDPDRPESVGAKRYSNQDYWKKAIPAAPTIDMAIASCQAEYEEIIDLHKTYGEA